MDSSHSKKKKRGISTFIATLLLIVLAVAAGVLIYAYTMGYLGGLSAPKGNPALQVQSVSEIGTTLHIYAKNIGSGSVVLDPNAMYVNDQPVAFTTIPTGNEIPEGKTWEIIINEAPLPLTINGKTSTIKMLAVGGTFATVSTKINNAAGGGGTTTYTLTVVYAGTGGGTVVLSPPGGSYAFGTPVTLTETPDASSDFTGWSGAGSGDPRVVTMNGDQTVTATFTAHVIFVPFSNGFEEGSFSAWDFSGKDDSVLEVIAGASHSGNYGMHTHSTGVAPYQSAYVQKTTGSSATYYSRFYLKINSWTGTDYIAITDHNNGWNTISYAIIDGSILTIRTRDGAGWSGPSAGYTLTTGQWYSVEMGTIVGSSGSASLWVNGNLVGTVNGVNNGYGNVDTILIGGLYDSGSGAVPLDLYIDDASVGSSRVGP